MRASIACPDVETLTAVWADPELVREKANDASALGFAALSANLREHSRVACSLQSARQLRLHPLRQRAHVGATGRALLQKRHDLAHVARGGRPRVGDALRDQRVEFGVGQLRGKVGLDHADFVTLLRSEILASRGLSAARISRTTPRRGLSPPFIAAFMSPVMRCFNSLMAVFPNPSIQTQK